MEQLHRIFKLCGTPSEGYFERLNLQQKSSFRSYKRCLSETFSDLSPSAVALLDKLLSLDPLERGSATSVLDSDVNAYIFTPFHFALLLDIESQ